MRMTSLETGNCHDGQALDVDGTLRPQSGAAPLGLPSAVFRAGSNQLGSTP